MFAVVDIIDGETPGWQERRCTEGEGKARVRPDTYQSISQSSLDDHLQHEVAVVVGRPARELEGLLRGPEALEPVGDHVVQARQAAAAAAVTVTVNALRTKEPDARRVRVGVAEDAEDVDLAQVGDGDRQGLDRRAHADHDDLPAGPRRVQARVHADLLPGALERHVHAVVLLVLVLVLVPVPVLAEGEEAVRRFRHRQGEHVGREAPGRLELAVDRAGGEHARRRRGAGLQQQQRGRRARVVGGGRDRGRGGAAAAIAAAAAAAAAAASGGGGGGGGSVRRTGYDEAVSREPLLQRVVHPAGVDVADRHRRAAGLTRHGGGQQADRLGADHEGGGARGRSGAIYRVDGDG